jgi:hypothetical protein
MQRRADEAVGTSFARKIPGDNMTDKPHHPTLAVDPDDMNETGGDQDIDTAGTDADTESPTKAMGTGGAPARQEAKAEIPGDTDSADIVGPTGEQMPQQSHDGVESDRRERP